MWSYVKGLIVGIFLLWFVLVASFAVKDGAISAGIYGFEIARFVLGSLQRITRGTGLYIAIFLILSLWVWSFGKKAPARKKDEVILPPKNED